MVRRKVFEGIQHRRTRQHFFAFRSNKQGECRHHIFRVMLSLECGRLEVKDRFSPPADPALFQGQIGGFIVRGKGDHRDIRFQEHFPFPGQIGVQNNGFACGVRQHELDSGVFLHGAVAVHMIARQIQHRGDLNGEGFRPLQLEGTDLHNETLYRAIFVCDHAITQTGTDVSGTFRRLARRLKEDSGQFGGGGLTVCPGDPDQGTIRVFCGKLQFPDDPVRCGFDLFEQGISRPDSGAEHSCLKTAGQRVGGVPRCEGIRQLRLFFFIQNAVRFFQKSGEACGGFSADAISGDQYFTIVHLKFLLFRVKYIAFCKNQS